MNCPKCARGPMMGPRYCRDDSVCGCRRRGEHLHYRCFTCGYEETTATADRVAERPQQGRGAA